MISIKLTKKCLCLGTKGVREWKSTLVQIFFCQWEIKAAQIQAWDWKWEHPGVVQHCPHHSTCTPAAGRLERLTTDYQRHSGRDQGGPPYQHSRDWWESYSPIADTASRNWATDSRTPSVPNPYSTHTALYTACIPNLDCTYTNS